MHISFWRQYYQLYSNLYCGDSKGVKGHLQVHLICTAPICSHSCYMTRW